MADDKVSVLLIYLAKGVFHFTPLFVFGYLISDENGGIYLIGLSVFSILVPLFDLGYRIFVYRNFRRSENYAIIDARNGVALKASILLLVIILPPYFFGDQILGKYIIYIVSAFIASLGNHLYFFLGATKSFSKEAVGYTVYAASFAIWSAGLYLTGAAPELAFLISSVLYFSTAVGYFVANSSSSTKLIESTRHFKDELRELLPYTAHIYIAVGIGLGDNLFISLFSPSELVVRYTAFLRLFLAMNFFTSAYVQLITPTISILVHKSDPVLLIRKIKLDHAVGAILGLIAALLYPVSVDVIFPILTDSVDIFNLSIIFGLLSFFRFASLSSSIIVSMKGNQWKRVYILAFFTATGYAMYFLIRPESMQALSLILLYMVGGTYLAYTKIGISCAQSD